MITFLIAVASFIAGVLSWAGFVAWAASQNKGAVQEIESLMAAADPKMQAAWARLKAFL